MSNFNQRQNDRAAHAAALQTSPLAPSVTSPVEDIAVATYRVKPTDVNGYKRFTRAAGAGIVFPLNATEPLPIGFEIQWEQKAAAGPVVASGDGGVTVNARGGALTTAGQFAIGFAKKVAADEWTVTGDLA